jgi:hypothetical protein
MWPPRSVSVNKSWGVGCASNAKRPLVGILPECSMLMNAQSWSVCAVRMPNCVWTVRF